MNNTLPTNTLAKPALEFNWLKNVTQTTAQKQCWSIVSANTSNTRLHSNDLSSNTIVLSSSLNSLMRQVLFVLLISFLLLISQGLSVRAIEQPAEALQNTQQHRQFHLTQLTQQRHVDAVKHTQHTATASIVATNSEIHRASSVQALLGKKLNIQSHLPTPTPAQVSIHGATMKVVVESNECSLKNLSFKPSLLSLSLSFSSVCQHCEVSVLQFCSNNGFPSAKELERQHRQQQTMKFESNKHPIPSLQHYQLATTLTSEEFSALYPVASFHCFVDVLLFQGSQQSKRVVAEAREVIQVQFENQSLTLIESERESEKEKEKRSKKRSENACNESEAHKLSTSSFNELSERQIKQTTHTPTSKLHTRQSTIVFPPRDFVYFGLHFSLPHTSIQHQHTNIQHNTNYEVNNFNRLRKTISMSPILQSQIHQQHTTSKPASTKQTQCSHPIHSQSDSFYIVPSSNTRLQRPNFKRSVSQSSFEHINGNEDCDFEYIQSMQQSDDEWSVMDDLEARVDSSSQEEPDERKAEQQKPIEFIHVSEFKDSPVSPSFSHASPFPSTSASPSTLFTRLCSLHSSACQVWDKSRSVRTLIGNGAVKATKLTKNIATAAAQQFYESQAYKFSEFKITDCSIEEHQLIASEKYPHGQPFTFQIQFSTGCKRCFFTAATQCDRDTEIKYIRMKVGHSEELESGLNHRIQLQLPSPPAALVGTTLEEVRRNTQSLNCYVSVLLNHLVHGPFLMRQTLVEIRPSIQHDYELIDLQQVKQQQQQQAKTKTIHSHATLSKQTTKATAAPSQIRSRGAATASPIVLLPNVELDLQHFPLQNTPHTNSITTMTTRSTHTDTDTNTGSSFHAFDEVQSPSSISSAASSQSTAQSNTRNINNDKPTNLFFDSDKMKQTLQPETLIQRKASKQNKANEFDTEQTATPQFTTTTLTHSHSLHPTSSSPSSTARNSIKTHLIPKQTSLYFHSLHQPTQTEANTQTNNNTSKQKQH